MKLLHMNIDELLEIDRIDSSNAALKERLNTLGLMPHSKISIARFGLFKSTVMVALGGNWVGLRKEEAASIEVHKVA